MKCHARYLTLLLLLISFATARAQREQNNIYLFDCTYSMIKAGIWEPAKEALDATITTQASIPGSTFAVIPFGDSPYITFNFDSDGYQSVKQNIIDEFGKDVKLSKFTHITDVLKEGFKNIDPNRENRIYLLTDGVPNGGDTSEQVAATIAEWCAAHKNCRLFYVALKEDVINRTIAQAVNNCPDAYIVQCRNGVIPQIADISSDVYTNIEELARPCDISFSLPGNYPVTISGSDSIFNVEVDGGAAADGRIRLSVSAKNVQTVEQLHSLLRGSDYRFDVQLQCSNSQYFIANPTVTIHIADEVPSRLSLAGGEVQTVLPGASWYDSFLWSSAAEKSPVVWNLEPEFANGLPQSAVTLKLELPESENCDFEAAFNGAPLKVGQTISIEPGKEAVLAVTFNHDASTGKRYLSLTPVNVDDIDMINGQPADDFDGITMRTTYSIDWNPLKTILFWLAIAIIATIVLWLLVLKRMFYPVIKVSKMQITGPGTYYLNKRIKGARKVVLTSARKSQNILSRIATGEIRYIKAGHFSPDIIIEPAAGKKKVKLRSAKCAPDDGWDIYPSMVFKQDDCGQLTNRSSKSISKIEFN